MWGLLANVAGQAINMWQANKSNDQAAKDYARKVRVNKTLAAEQLAITYNSILAKSLQVNAEARRQQFKIRTEERKVEGQVAVQAAQTGAIGRRAELARKMAVSGGAEHAMTTLEMDTQRAQDDLIRRADMEERATVNRLISSMPDAPVDETGANLLDFATGALGAYGKYKKQNQEVTDAITGLDVNGKIGSTGINQYGVQAKL